jgi:hypothetical protein
VETDGDLEIPAESENLVMEGKDEERMQVVGFTFGWPVCRRRCGKRRGGQLS